MAPRRADVPIVERRMQKFSTLSQHSTIILQSKEKRTLTDKELMATLREWLNDMNKESLQW